MQNSAMDVDISMSAEDQYMQYFDVTPALFPWRAPRPQEIQPHTIYPPTDTQSLQTLLDMIANSTYDTLKQDCLVYFLLKWYQDGREEDFLEKRCIPPQFATLSDAYWHLDTGINVARAVSMLSDARLNRDYTTKVLQALSLADDPHTLIRTFIRTAKPLLTEPDDIDAYAIALAESSLMEAWTYQRSFSENSDTRMRLIRKILQWCLTPKPRLTPLTHLLAFPLTPFEQALVHNYALGPPSHLPSSAVTVIQDLVCVRLVQSGQHAAAIKLDRQFASTPGSGERSHDRRQMMDELMAAMPAAERLLLELELEQFAQGRGMSDGKGKGKAMDMSMSMSWQHIAPSSTINATIVPPTPPISQRSGAPRFGGPAPASAAPANEELFPSTSRGIQSTALQMPKPPSTGPLLFGIPPQPPATTNASTTNNWKPKSTVNGTPSLFGSSNNRPSLFNVTGSANAAPNAFYQPPASTSANRVLFFGPTASRPAEPAPVSAFTSLSGKPASAAAPKQSGRKSGGGPGDTSMDSVKGPHDTDIDVSMLSELSESDSARADDSVAAVSRALDDSADMDVSAEFSVSVFGGPTSHRKIATNRGARIARTETEAMLPPGAFLPEDEGDEGERDEEQSISSNARTSAASKGRAKRPRAPGAASRRGRGAPREPTPEPQPQPEPAPPRTSARRRRAPEKEDLGRSIPGALMDDDYDTDGDAPAAVKDEDEEEEEDYIAPLPTPARRSSRKSRVSNVGQVETPRMTRRSSRLSVVSSVGSSSPEPPSPQKPSAARRVRKSTRTSAVGANSAGAGVGTKGTKTRKKRA